MSRCNVMSLYFSLVLQVKHNKGKKIGRRIWVVGMVEQATNRIKIVPVLKRNKSTLRKIILDNVTVGSQIHTDCWKGYIGISESGFRHFTVNHKYFFSQCYVHDTTKERKYIHTNSIEGAWKHMKVSVKLFLLKIERRLSEL